MNKLLTIGCLCLLALTSLAGKVAAQTDSTAAQRDSLVQALRNQVQELQLQRIMMQEQMQRSGQSARHDSLLLEQRKARIDSLRKITPGAPLIVGGDTLLKLYARKGGLLPEKRVEDIREAIVETGQQLRLFADSVYVFEGDFSTDIMAGDRVVMSVTDEDALWQNKSRQLLAADYRSVIEAKIHELHSEYGLKQKMLGVLYAVFVIVLMVAMIRLTNWAYHRWRFRAMRYLLKRARPLAVKDYEVLNLHQMGIVIARGCNVVRYLVVLTLLFFCVPMVFSAFPETKSLAYTIFGYVWNPFVSIVGAVIGFLPNFFQIVVIVLCFRYLVKGLHYLTNEIASGRLKLNGFYADWAQPTYLILRVLCYSFMLVMIWPLLPSSNSEVFQGVSVFIGIIVSLGSSSIIGNIMAGMVMTYMRPFHVGDFIKYGDTEGFVIEKTVLVTRIRTRKNNVITIPNSNLMGSQTTNYTFSAQNYGLIVHTKVTIGYDMPWQQIRQLLLDAARATKGLKQHPEPFVLVTSLDDYYVEYELNAYTTQSDRLPLIYSELRHNILDSFHSHGVEIMSPHIYAHRSDLELQIPKGQAPQ
jgi:small-conductance mechanosensitive channel